MTKSPAPVEILPNTIGNLVKQLSLQDILLLEKEVEKQKAKFGKIGKIAAEFQKRLASWNTKLGTAFTLDDVMRHSANIGPTRKRRRAVARYRNPDNLEETWVGQGRTPNWLKRKTEAGHKTDEFRIKDEPVNISGEQKNESQGEASNPSDGS